MTSTTFYTLYAPYRTAQAVENAEHSDMILLRSSGRTLVAVHPVPATWLSEHLWPEEQIDVLNHINAVIANRGASSVAFIQAVRLTRDRLETLEDGASHPTIPGRAPAPYDRNSTEVGSGTTSQPPRESGWNASNHGLDAVAEDFGRMSIAPSQHTLTRPTQRNQGQSRSTSHSETAQGVELEAQPPHISPFSASFSFNHNPRLSADVNSAQGVELSADVNSAQRVELEAQPPHVSPFSDSSPFNHNPRPSAHINSAQGVKLEALPSEFSPFSASSPINNNPRPSAYINSAQGVELEALPSEFSPFSASSPFNNNPRPSAHIDPAPHRPLSRPEAFSNNHPVACRDPSGHQASTMARSPADARGPSPTRDALAALHAALEEVGYILIQQFETSEWIENGGRELDEARDFIDDLRSSHRIPPDSLDLARSMVEATRRAVEDALSRRAVRGAVGNDERLDRHTQLRREHSSREEVYTRARREREDRSRERARQEQQSAAAENLRLQQEQCDLTIAQNLQDEFRLQQWQEQQSVAAENLRRQQEYSDLTIAQNLQDEFRLEHREPVEDEQEMRRRRQKHKEERVDQLESELAARSRHRQSREDHDDDGFGRNPGGESSPSDPRRPRTRPRSHAPLKYEYLDLKNRRWVRRRE